MGSPEEMREVLSSTEEGENGIFTELKTAIEFFEVDGNEENYQHKTQALQIINELGHMQRSKREEWNNKVHDLFLSVARYDATKYTSSDANKHPKQRALELIQQLRNEER